MLSKDLRNKSVLLLVSIVLPFLFTLSGCGKETYQVALYEGINNRDNILGIFHSQELAIAIQNCQNALALQKENDRKTGRIEQAFIITGTLPVYYCHQFEDKM